MKKHIKYICFILVLVLFFLCFTFIRNMKKDNDDFKNDQKAKEVVLFEETLKGLDSLNERIDSLTVKNDIKFGRIVEIKKKEKGKKN